MLLLIISLFLNYDLFSCLDNGMSKFNETILMQKHYKNYLQVKTFIKEAQKKFHEDTPPSRVDYPQFTTRGLDNTSSIDLAQPSRFFVPVARARPSFPVSITPYTTELIAHKMKWEEILPLLTTRTSVPGFRIGPPLSSTRKITSHPSFKMSLPSPKYQKRFGPSLPSAVSFQSTPQTTNTQNRTRPFYPNSTVHASLRGHSDKDLQFNQSNMTRNEEYKKKWLREITTYTPVESWFLTLANNIELIPRFSLTTKHAPQLGRTLTQTQVSAPRKQLKTDSIHPEKSHFRNALLTPKTATKLSDGKGTSTHNTTTTTTASTKPKFFIENHGGILHLRTIPEKDEAKTTTVGKTPVPESTKDVIMQITTGFTLATTGYTLRRDQELAANKVPSVKKSRRLHLKPKKKHRYLRHKNVERQKYQRYRYRHPEYSHKHVYRRKQEKVEDPMLSSSFYTPKVVFKSNEDRKLGEPTHPPNSMLQFPEDINSEDVNLSTLKETKKESRRKGKAQKDKISFYNQIKETLKQVESRKKAKRLKIKAELIRKIVEGSSYSDEEESLKKNLMQALQHGNKT